MVTTDGGRPILLPRTIVTYTLSHLSQTDKVRFYYALKGRNGNGGIISQTGIRQLAKTVILADSLQEKTLVDFLSEWGCTYSTLHVKVKNDFRNHRQNNHHRRNTPPLNPPSPTHSQPKTHTANDALTIDDEVHPAP